MARIPQEIWRRWDTKEYQGVRQMLVVFDGSPRKEPPLEKFSDVSLISPDGNITGVLYLTSRRLIFLPMNTFPHSKMVHATYNNLSGLKGTANDRTISLIDKTHSLASFKFPSQQSLFQCFNLLRFISEASRHNEENFRKAILEVANEAERDETPFISIEVDLADCGSSPDVVHEALVEPVSVPPSETEQDYLKIGKIAADYITHVHFDIYIKLRIVVFVAFISFVLKFIPLLPLVCLLAGMSLLYNGWQKLDFRKEVKDQQNDDENDQISKLRKFLLDWFAWENTKKSRMMLNITFGIGLSWLLLPDAWYILGCIVSFAFFVVFPLMKDPAVGEFLRV